MTRAERFGLFAWCVHLAITVAANRFTSFQIAIQTFKICNEGRGLILNCVAKKEMCPLAKREGRYIFMSVFPFS